MSDATAILTEPLMQYGAIGAILIYCLYTDWQSRRENRRIESDRDKRDAKREEDCVSRIRQLEDRNTRFIQSVSGATNAVLKDLVDVLREKGINLKTPLPDTVPFEEAETRVIHRTKP